MIKKPKSEPDGKKIHIRELSSCCSLALHALSLKEILRAKLVSKWFRERCQEALGLLTFFDYPMHHLDNKTLGHLLACCRNIQVIESPLLVRNFDVVFGALRSWKNLLALSLTANDELDGSLQGMLIPKIAALAPNLKKLHLCNMLKGKVYLTPLSKMKNLQQLFFYDSKPEESTLIGLDVVLNNCQISVLGVDHNCDFFAVVNMCDNIVLERLVRLLVYCERVTHKDCATLARLCNLTYLGLFSEDISNDGIQDVSSLKHIKVLLMNFDRLTPGGMSFITSGFTMLEEVYWRGNLSFDQAWLKVLERSHGGLHVVDWR